MHLLDFFDKFSLRPENAKELKGLILDLAIRGRLTEEWRKEHPINLSPAGGGTGGGTTAGIEPASVLLQRIQAEKARLVKEKKIKKEKPLPEITEEEIPFSLPEGWEWDYMGNIGSTNVGLTYKPRDVSEKGTPVLRSSNIQNGKIDLTDLKKVNAKYNEKDIIKEGDLLICARNGSRKLVGKCAIFDNSSEIFVFGAFMAIFRSRFNKFIQLFINSPLYRSRLEGVETTTINQITQGNLKATLIPLPPLPEQQAIVAIVNQLMAEVDELQAQTTERAQLRQNYVQSALRQLTTADSSSVWHQLKPQFPSFFDTAVSIDKLKEAILQLAVQGKLTKQWREENPDVEPASVLLEKIKEEKARLIKEKKIKKDKPLPEITEEEIPFELPEGWVWCRFGDIFTIKSSKRIFKSEYVLDGVPFYRSKEIGQLGRGEEVTTELFITREKYERIKETFGIPNQGDVLIACIGGSIGNTWLSDDREYYYKDGNLVQINRSEYIESYFLLKYLDSTTFYDSALGRVSGSAYNALTIEKIKKSIFPLSCQEEQRSIIRIVNQLIDYCDHMKFAIENRNTLSKDFLRSSIREVMEQTKALV